MDRRNFLKKIGKAAGVSVCAPVVISKLVCEPVVINEITEVPSGAPGWIDQIRNGPWLSGEEYFWKHYREGKGVEGILYGTRGFDYGGVADFKKLWSDVE